MKSKKTNPQKGKTRISPIIEKRIHKYTENLAILLKFLNYENPVENYLDMMNDINNKCLGGKFEGEIVDRSIELFKKMYRNA